MSTYGPQVTFDLPSGAGGAAYLKKEIVVQARGQPWIDLGDRFVECFDYGLTRSSLHAKLRIDDGGHHSLDVAMDEDDFDRDRITTASKAAIDADTHHSIDYSSFEVQKIECGGVRCEITGVFVEGDAR